MSCCARVGHLAQALSACLLDVGVSNGGKKGKKSKGKGKGHPSPPSYSPPPSSSSGDGMLYSIKVKLEIPPAPAHFRGKDQGPKSPFWSNELVALGSPRWGLGSGETFLAVVQSWDPVYDKQSHKSHAKHVVLLRLLVCASSTGGDGVGGRGGWLPRKHIQECLGKGKKSAGVAITLSSGASLTTACREFQAVMSMSELPEGMRRWLLDPRVNKESRRAALPWQRSSSFSSNSRAGGFTRGGEGEKGSGASGKGEMRADGDGDGDGYAKEDPPPPSNVPTKLWNTLLHSYNRSQVQAIRKVVDGSPSGFTLLQVRSDVQPVDSSTPTSLLC